jgi:hypothetical protein
MSLLGKLKNKAIGKKDDLDYDEVRSHILGDSDLPPPMKDDYAPMENVRPGKREQEEFPYAKRREPIGIEPLQSDMDFSREPISMRASDNYEVLDRLKFIENQLAAIRSQTETINERLKNMEMRLGRRF